MLIWSALLHTCGCCVDPPEEPGGLVLAYTDGSCGAVSAEMGIRGLAPPTGRPPPSRDRCVQTRTRMNLPVPRLELLSYKR